MHRRDFLRLLGFCGGGVLVAASSGPTRALAQPAAAGDSPLDFLLDGDSLAFFLWLNRPLTEAVFFGGAPFAVDMGVTLDHPPPAETQVELGIWALREQLALVRVGTPSITTAPPPLRPLVALRCYAAEPAPVLAVLTPLLQRAVAGGSNGWRLSRAPGGAA